MFYPYSPGHLHSPRRLNPTLKYALFKQLVQDLLNQISRETSIALALAVVNTRHLERELVSETMAAKAFSSVIRTPDEDRAELVVDIGGGTTDMAMLVRKGNEIYELVESIRYGGKQYLKFLAERFNDQPKDNGKAINNVEDRVIALQKLIRGDKNGIDGVLRCYGGKGGTAARSRIDRFFTGIFFYIYKLLEKYNMKKVNFYPVGNGWRLIEGLKNPSYTIENYIKTLFKHREIDSEVTLPSNIIDLKGAVCRGAKKIAEDADYVHPKNIEVKTIVGATVKVGEKTLSWDEMVPTGALAPAPLPAINTTEFINEFLASTGISDLRVSKSQINAALRQQFGNAYFNLPAEQVGLKKSVLSVFLEHIYPHMFLY